LKGIGVLDKPTLAELAKQPHEEDHCWKCGDFIRGQTWIGILCEQCNDEFGLFESAKLYEKKDFWAKLPENDHEKLIAEFILAGEKVLLT